MINLFTIPPNDQSLYFIGQLFGFMGNIYPPPAGTPSLILGTMFKTFNTVVLGVGALVVVYITIMGVLKTASEGEFLGKQWSSLWVPLKTVIGIAALVPTSSGYCAIQMVMMWVILQGIGAADTLWTTALSYINTMGGATQGPTLPTTVGITNSIQQLFQGLVCQATARVNPQTQLSLTGLPYYCNQNVSPFCTANIFQITDSMTVYNMGPGDNKGACGTVTLCDVTTQCQPPPPPNATQPPNATTPTKLGCYACKAQRSALQQIIPVLGGIAAQFAGVDLAYRQFFTITTPEGAKNIPSWIQSYCSKKGIQPCCLAPGKGANQIALLTSPGQQQCPTEESLFPPVDGAQNSPSSSAVLNLYWPYALQQYGDFLQLATNTYAGALVGALQQQITEQGTNNVSNSKYATAQQNGWIFAGAYYYQIAQVNNSNLQNSLPVFTVDLGDPNSKGNVLNAYRNNFTAATYLIQAVNGAGQAGPGGLSSLQISISGAPQLSNISTAIQSGFGGIFQHFMSTISGSRQGHLATDPLQSLQQLGQNILIAIQVILSVILSVMIGILIFGYFDAFVLGTGFSNPVGPVMSTVTLVILPILVAFMGTFFAFGSLLAIYTPLIPYILFTFGAVAWFISTIEAMVAGPLVALAILAPSGGHELLGKAEHALMFLFSIFLRPSLMIFGMIASILLAVVVVTMINSGFLLAVSQTLSSNPGLVELVLFIGAYVFLIIAALNKCFSLIHVIPERVLSWIGGQAIAGGEDQAMGEAKRGFEGAAAGAGGMGTAAVGKGQEGVGKAAKHSKQVSEGKGEAKLGGLKGMPKKGPGVQYT